LVAAALVIWGSTHQHCMVQLIGCWWWKVVHVRIVNVSSEVIIKVPFI
jgi:hypothetical protein